MITPSPANKCVGLIIIDFCNVDNISNTSLDLEFVHGYSGKTPFQECKTDNVFMLASGEMIFPASASHAH